jgi:hypothetical protein
MAHEVKNKHNAAVCDILICGLEVSSLMLHLLCTKGSQIYASRGSHTLHN